MERGNGLEEAECGRRYMHPVHIQPLRGRRGEDGTLSGFAWGVAAGMIEVVGDLVTGGRFVYCLAGGVRAFQGKAIKNVFTDISSF